MKKTMPTLCLISALSPFSAFADNFSGSIQGYFLNKSYSVDSDVSVDIAGVYSYLGYGKHSLELEVDTLKVKDDDISKQDDFTLMYSNYQLANWKLKLGLHNVNMASPSYSFDDVTFETNISRMNDKLNAVIMGAQYTDYFYSYKKWQTGIDVIYASFDNSNNNFTQISPHYGQYFSATKAGHYYYAGITLHTQVFKFTVNGEYLYLNPDISLKYVMPSTSFMLSAELGDNVNQFNLGGFSYNGGSLMYTENLAFTVAHSFTPNLFMKAILKQQYYLPASTTNSTNDKESISSVQLSLGYNF